MKIFIVCVLFLIVQNISAQNQSPVVSNVVFYERTDRSFFVDIYYDLFDADNDTMQVSISASDNAGRTWDFSADSVWGDIGKGITSATGKHIIWDFGAEHRQFYSDSIQIKIIADNMFNCGKTISYAGKIYNTVLIGSQCWLKENLNVGTMIITLNDSVYQTDNGIIEKFCYINAANNCDTYGGLYQWDEAMQYDSTEGIQGICPDGWHIPTKSDFLTLSNFVNKSGNSLKAVGQGTGTNISGFSALIAGTHYPVGGFDELFDKAFFWSSTKDNGSADILRLFWGYDDIQIYSYSYGITAGHSIRCLKD